MSTPPARPVTVGDTLPKPGLWAPKIRPWDTVLPALPRERGDGDRQFLAPSLPASGQRDSVSDDQNRLRVSRGLGAAPHYSRASPPPALAEAPRQIPRERAWGRGTPGAHARPPLPHLCPNTGPSRKLPEEEGERQASWPHLGPGWAVFTVSDSQPPQGPWGSQGSEHALGWREPLRRRDRRPWPPTPRAAPWRWAHSEETGRSPWALGGGEVGGTDRSQ